MNKEQLAEQYASDYYPAENWNDLKEIFLAALTLELAMDTAPKDGTEILVKDEYGWHIAQYFDIIKGFASHAVKINNPQCWRPL